jgi:HTH-type transcriptional regulator/antitoxin HipB
MSARVRTVADLSAVIKARRLALGLDQAELADRARVSRLWINEVEKGKPGAGIGRILRTLAVLGLTVEVAEDDPVARRRRNSRTSAAITQALTARLPSKNR